jgi:hypothetical protein
MKTRKYSKSGSRRREKAYTRSDVHQDAKKRIAAAEGRTRMLQSHLKKVSLDAAAALQQLESLIGRREDDSELAQAFLPVLISLERMRLARDVAAYDTHMYVRGEGNPSGLGIPPVEPQTAFNVSLGEIWRRYKAFTAQAVTEDPSEGGSDGNNG